jgi:hypothetical protein
MGEVMACLSGLDRSPAFNGYKMNDIKMQQATPEKKWLAKPVH